MNSDILEGKWKQLKGQAQQKWGSITDDEWEKIAGRKEEFIGLLQEKEGTGREQAEREFEAFVKSQQ